MTDGRDPLAGITVLRALREDIEWWSSRCWACSGWMGAWLAIILFPGRCPKLQVLALLRWGLSLTQQRLQRLAKEKWSKMQVSMKILGCLLLLLYLHHLKEKCCTEKLVTWPSHAFVVMDMDCSSAWPWEVTQESELVCSHSAHCTELQLHGKILRDPHHERGLTLFC